MRRLLHAWIGALAQLVPAAARREFRAEWEAELAVDPTMRRASGAAADAWFLRRQALSLDSCADDLRYAVRVLAPLGRSRLVAPGLHRVASSCRPSIDGAAIGSGAQDVRMCRP